MCGAYDVESWERLAGYAGSVLRVMLNMCMNSVGSHVKIAKTYNCNGCFVIAQHISERIATLFIISTV